MRLVTRAQWGALSRTLPTNITPQHGGVTFHYVGSSAINDSHANCAARVRGIQSFHINGNGWTDIAYSLLVCQHGYVFVGRGVNRRTAANGTNSGNQNWYAVCFLVGGSQAPTALAVQAGRDAVAYLRVQGRAGRGINGHRDHLATSCPGTPAYGLVRSGELEPDTAAGGGGSVPGGRPVLRQGSTGPAVRTLQELLGVTVDGDFGPLTDRAVRDFQQANGLTVDGVVGPATWAALERDGDTDMPDRNLYATTTGYVQPIPSGEWTTLRFDRIFRNGAWETKTPEPSFVFGPSFYSASVGVRVTGLERGQEFQVRLAYYREAAGGGWERYATMPIDSPVHDAGSGHFTTSWNGHVGGSSKGRVRVEVIHYGPETQTVAVDFARAEALVWSG